MTCAKARLVLTRALRESLPPEVSDALHRHLRKCSACADEQRFLGRTDVLLGAAPPNAIGDFDFSSAISRAKRPSLTPRIPIRPATGIVLCGIVVIAALTLPRILRWAQSSNSPELQPTSVASVPAVKGSRKTVSLAEPAIRTESTIVKYRAPGAASRPNSAGRSVETPAIVRSVPPVIRPSLAQKNAPHSDAAPEAPPVVESPGSGVLAVSFAPDVIPRVETGAVDALFRDDPRLKARLELGAADRTLGELIPSLGKRWQVRLVADRSVADDKITLFLKARPAAEVLTLIGRHLGFRWLRNREGYELTQDLAGKRREQALLRNELTAIENQLVLAARLLPLQPAILRERLTDIDKRIAEGKLSAEERAELTAEKQTTGDVLVSRDAVSLSLGLFRQLSQSQIDSLFDGTEVRFSTVNDSLSPAAAEQIRRSTNVLESLGGPLPQIQADATIRLSDEADFDEIPAYRRNRQLRLRCVTLSLRGEMERPANWGGEWSPTIPTPVPLPHAAAPDPELDRVVELSLPGPERPGGNLGGIGMAGMLRPDLVWRAHPKLSDIASELAKATGWEVVADSFTPVRIEAALLRGRRPVRDILTVMAQELDYTWEKRGDTLFLRDRRYFLDRPAEAPERLIRAYRERALQQQIAPLDSLATLVSELSNAQVRSLYRNWGWYLEGSGLRPPDWLYSRRFDLRLWATFTLPQRQALLSGKTLPVSAVTPLQRALWLAALMSPPETARTPANAQRFGTPEELEAGGFSLNSGPAQAILYLRTDPQTGSRTATTTVVDGPTDRDIRGLTSVEDPDTVAQPALALEAITFNYFLGGNAAPARSIRLMLSQRPIAKR